MRCRIVRRRCVALHGRCPCQEVNGLLARSQRLSLETMAISVELASFADELRMQVSSGVLFILKNIEIIEIIELTLPATHSSKY